MFGDERADAYAALVVTLRHGVDEHHLLLYAGEMERRDVRRARVAELAVYFVGKQEEVINLLVGMEQVLQHSIIILLYLDK